MKNIDKKQLKILSLEFRTIANRLINCNFHTGMDLLRKFIAYIDENEIISDYIQGHVNPDDFQPVSPRTTFSSMGDTKQEEISYTYQYLKYALENYNDFYTDMAWGYAKEANDAVKEFCNRIILPFVNYIEGYLTEIGIKMGYDEDTKFMIHVHGGVAQVNVANDSGTVNATQNNGIEASQLDKIISDILSNAPSNLPSEEQEQITDDIEVIRTELVNPTPRKSLIKTALRGLQAINGTAQFGAAVAALVEFIGGII